MDGRHLAEPLLLERRGIEDRRALEAGGAAGHRDRSPSVRAARQIFGIDGLLVAAVDAVAHAQRGQRDVVADLARVAEEVVAIERAAETDEAAARQGAGRRAVARRHQGRGAGVAVPIHERRHERVDGGIGADLGHREQPDLVQVGDVEVRPDRVRDGDVGGVVGDAGGLQRKVRVLEVQVARRIDDPRAVRGADLLTRLVPGTGCGRLELAEERAGIFPLRVPIARVDQRRMGRRQRELAETLVPDAGVVRQLTIHVRAVLTVLFRTVVRSEEEQVVLEDGPADVRLGPAAIQLVAREAAVVQLCRHVVVLQLVADLSRERARARLAHRVDREAAGADEINGPRAPLDDRHLCDVVRSGFGRQRAEERQGHIDAVELVDVVLPAAARARAARRVLRVLHAGNQLDQVAVFLADRDHHDLIVRDAARDRGRGLVHQRGVGGDGHRLGDAAHAQRGICRGDLRQLHGGLLRGGLHAGQRERQGVLSGRQRRQLIGSVAAGDGHAWTGQHVGPRFDGDAGQHAAARVGDLALNRSGLLGVCGKREEGEEKDQKRTKTYTCTKHSGLLHESAGAADRITPMRWRGPRRRGGRPPNSG